MNGYHDFIINKTVNRTDTGIAPGTIHEMLFPFQRHTVEWALSIGKAAIFADCGLGKTLMQLEWARHIPGNVLIVAPLAVSKQTQREGAKIDIPVTICRHQPDANPGVNITNYEMLEHFDPSYFTGVVLDESSIIKNYSGSMRNQIIDMFRDTPYKLACTATPSPNDFMELGNHSEFLNNLSRAEMLSMYFIHDGGDTARWRLKHHAEREYWGWVRSWGMMYSDPAEIGFSMNGHFKLPPLNVNEIIVPYEHNIDGMLFPMMAQTLQERRQARRDSIKERVRTCADLVNNSDDIHLVWCNLNDESRMLTDAVNDAVEIKGTDDRNYKEQKILDFADGNIKALITKPSIAGFGVNWQVCHNMHFVGLSDSYEQYYQALRRCWRFGQKHPVNVNIITGELEGAVLENIKRKDADAMRMREMMIQNITHSDKPINVNEYRDIPLPSFIGG